MDNNGISDLYASIFSGTTGLIALVFYILVAIGLWKVFTKAGYPGILAIIPIANLILAIIVAFKLGERFNKGGVFSFFLLFLFPYIGYLILGFGDSRYSKA